MEATKILRTKGYDNLIIALTGNVMDDDVMEFLQAGADAVLAKPITTEQLDQIIAYVMRNGCGSVIKRGMRLAFYENHFLMRAFGSGKYLNRFTESER